MNIFARQPLLIIASIFIMCVTIPFIIAMIVIFATCNHNSHSCKAYCHHDANQNDCTRIKFGFVVPLLRKPFEDSNELEFRCMAVVVNKQYAILGDKLCIPEFEENRYYIRFDSEFWIAGGFLSKVLSSNKKSENLFVLKVEVPKGACVKYPKIFDDAAFKKFTAGEHVGFRASPSLAPKQRYAYTNMSEKNPRVYRIVAQDTCTKTFTLHTNDFCVSSDSVKCSKVPDGGVLVSNEYAVGLQLLKRCHNDTVTLQLSRIMESSLQNLE